jgi:hypothetical protein
MLDEPPEELLLELEELPPPLLELEELLLEVEAGAGSLDPHAASRLLATRTQAMPCSFSRSILCLISQHLTA